MHSCNKLVDWMERDISQYNKHEWPVHRNSYTTDVRRDINSTMAVHFPGFTVVQKWDQWTCTSTEGLSPPPLIHQSSHSVWLDWWMRGGGTDKETWPNVIFSYNIWCYFGLCSTSTCSSCHMKLNFCFFSECITFTIFSLRNKWTVNLHKYNDDTELLNSCETLLINFKIV